MANDVSRLIPAGKRLQGMKKGNIAHFAATWWPYAEHEPLKYLAFLSIWVRKSQGAFVGPLLTIGESSSIGMMVRQAANGANVATDKHGLQKRTLTSSRTWRTILTPSSASGRTLLPSCENACLGPQKMAVQTTSRERDSPTRVRRLLWFPSPQDQVHHRRTWRPMPRPIRLRHR